MKFRTLPLSKVKRGERILVRIDANIPLHKGRIPAGGAWRLEKVVDDIRALSKRGAIVIVCAHFGRPGGKRVDELSAAPAVRWFNRIGKVKMLLAPGVAGPEVNDFVDDARSGDVIILENLRFDPRERENDKTFASELASLADIYINDAFANSHRKHASMHAITKLLPSYAGRLVVEEVKALSVKQKKKFVLVMGGMKLATKMPVLERLAPTADVILTGGGLALTLEAARERRALKINGKEIDPAELKLARHALKLFSGKMVLPIDVIVRNEEDTRVLWADEVDPGDAIIDIGPKTRDQYAQHIDGANTVIWNGTMGIVEESVAQAGTIAIARSISEQEKAVTILGGGDTVSFLRKKKLATGFTHLSTGGGAMLVFLAGDSMPGLEVLKK